MFCRDGIPTKGRTLLFVDLHVEGIDVLLGVHAPLAIVLGGEDRLFGSILSAVVGRASLRLPDFEVLDKEEKKGLRCGYVPCSTSHKMMGLCLSGCLAHSRSVAALRLAKLMSPPIFSQ